jgi:hypothetical protein
MNEINLTVADDLAKLSETADVPSVLAVKLIDFDVISEARCQGHNTSSYTYNWSDNYRVDVIDQID